MKIPKICPTLPILVIAFLPVVPLVAHHSILSFDRSHPGEIHGAVLAFQWRKRGSANETQSRSRGRGFQNRIPIRSENGTSPRADSGGRCAFPLELRSLPGNAGRITRETLKPV